MWFQNTYANIMTMQTIDLRLAGMTLLAVALENCKVCFYSEKFKVGEFSTDTPIMSMIFGRFGREDNTLVLVGKGNLDYYFSLISLFYLCNQHFSIMFTRWQFIY